MTILRLISPALRSGILVLAGTTLITFPFLLGLGPAPIVTGTTLGIAMVALALAGTDSSGRGTIPLAAQAAYDRGLGLGLLVTGIVFGLANETAAGIVFAIAGIAALIVASITSYSARPA